MREEETMTTSELDEKLKYKVAEAEYLLKYRPESNSMMWTPPESFLDVVKPPFQWNEASLNDLREKMKKGVEIDPPFVDVEPKYCTIISHEGRHRAKAASELGIEEIPVLMYCRNRERGFVNYHECKPCEFIFEKWKWKKEREG